MNREALERVKAEARKRLALKAQALRTEVVRELSHPGSGRTYGRHTASKPGDPPAPDTGRLRQSIGVQRVDEDTMRVGTNVVYAPLLEFGTRRIAPRPFFRPAIERFKEKL